MNDINCMNCAGCLKLTVRDVFDTRFGVEGFYHIYRCADCGLEQTRPVPKLEELIRLYEEYYNFRGKNDSSYTNLRTRLFSSVLYRIWLWLDGDISFHLSKGRGRLLDIGCNEGRGLRFYEQNGFSAEGLELNGEAARVARTAGFVVHTKLLGNFQPDQPFDVAVLSNVLEHDLNPKRMLADVRRILGTKGQVWISCPNNKSLFRSLFGRYWINWHAPFHIIHFSADTLREMLENSGFEEVSIVQETPALWVSHSLLAALFARPGKSNPKIRSPLLVIILLGLIRGIFFPVLFFANRTGRGDCLVATARVRR